MENKSNFKNFVKLTVTVKTFEAKTSRDGNPYGTGTAEVTFNEGTFPLKLKVFGGIVERVSAGETLTLKGKLAYEEWTGTRDGKKHQDIILMADGIDPEPGKNFVNLSLMAIKDGNAQYSDKGTMWAKVRGMMGQGKDQDGEWKPALFLDVKGFAKPLLDEDKNPIVEGGQEVMDESIPQAIGGLFDKTRFNVSGFLTAHEYSPEDGVTHTYWGVTAFKLEPFEELAPVEELSDDEIPD